LAVIDGLGFDIRQSGANLLFEVFQPVDRSASIRMDIDNNHLSKTEYTVTAPAITRTIVAGGGVGADRTFVEVAASSEESSWARRIETFIDQRNSTDSTELTQTGTQALNEKGLTLEAISVTPTDDETMEFGVDWGLGDKVSVVVGETVVSKIVTEVGLLISEDGVRIGATVGDPSTADEESTVVDAQQDQETRISNLERNTTDVTSGGGGGGGSHGNHPVAWEDITDVPSTFTPSAHTHAIADVTGLQTALDSKVDESYSTVSTGWLTAGTGWGSISGIYTEKNGIVQVNLRATRTGATIAAGNITNINVMTIAAGYRPITETAAISGPSGPLASAYIATTGGVAISALGTSLASGDAIDINATYILA